MSQLPACDCGHHYLAPNQQPNWDGPRDQCPVLAVEQEIGVSLRSIEVANNVSKWYGKER